jgi:hypothetical protein
MSLHGTFETCRPLRRRSASEGKAEGAERRRTAAFDPACVKTAFNDMILLRLAGGFDDALCRWR